MEKYVLTECLALIRHSARSRFCAVVNSKGSKKLLLFDRIAYKKIRKIVNHIGNYGGVEEI